MKKNESGIYMIISPTAKVYIGQSVNVNDRAKAYKKIDCRNQRRLFNSLKKYGFDSHYFDIVEYCPINELNQKERFWQDEYQVLKQYGLNCRLTGSNDANGNLSEKTKRKISEALKGRVFSDETKVKMGAWQKGIKRKPLSKEHKKKISLGVLGKGMKGRTHSDETKRKIALKSKGRQTRLGAKLSEETKNKIREKAKGRLVSEETRKKISEAGKGQIPWNKGKHLSDEHKKKIMEGMKKAKLEKVRIPASAD